MAYTTDEMFALGLSPKEVETVLTPCYMVSKTPGMAQIITHLIGKMDSKVDEINKQEKEKENESKTKLMGLA